MSFLYWRGTLSSVRERSLSCSSGGRCRVSEFSAGHVYRNVLSSLVTRTIAVMPSGGQVVDRHIPAMSRFPSWHGVDLRDCSGSEH